MKIRLAPVYFSGLKKGLVLENVTWLTSEKRVKYIDFLVNIYRPYIYLEKKLWIKQSITIYLSLEYNQDIWAFFIWLDLNVLRSQR